MLCFRKAKAEDDCMQLIEKGRMAKGRDDLIMAAFEEDTLIGVCSMQIEEQDAEIKSIFVEQEGRHKGIGFALVKSILNVVERRGIKTVWVTRCGQADRFFNKLGFSASEEKPNMLYVEMEGYFDQCCCK